MSLAVADLLVGLIVMPIALVTVLNSKFSMGLCFWKIYSPLYPYLYWKNMPLSMHKLIPWHHPD